MPPKRVSPDTPTAAPVPKRARRVANSSVATPANPVTPSATTAAVENPITPTSTAKGSSKKKDEDDDSNSKKKPSVIESDAFSRGFFNAIGPATDAYYNKESNLVRLDCFKYDRQKSSADAQTLRDNSRKEFLMTLREHEESLSAKALEQFRHVQATDSDIQLAQIQKDREILKTNRLRYELDVERMITERDNRKTESDNTRVVNKSTAGMEQLAAIRRKMLNGGAGPSA
ncbi:hypothetical protein RHS03_02171, partial [Rhizoctonia solani]